MRLTLDYPPVWLAGFAALAWGSGRLLPHGPGWLVWPGGALVAAGVILMGVAALQMHRHRTTIDPHGQPSALVTSGVFGLSRNPIYLADALILAGLCLCLQVPIVALALVPGFMLVVRRRFIANEEARLAEAFPREFAAYRQRSRRWI